MSLMVRPDKVNDIIAMFASIVMKIAAGVAGHWERLLIGNNYQPPSFA